MDTATIRARILVNYQPKNEQRFLLDVDLTLPGKGITAIFGASGSGKTTLLRSVAGLQRVNEGELIINGDVWLNSIINIPTHQRPIGYVFQESSLFEHLTAHGNLAYALKRARNPKMQERCQRIIALMGIEHLLQQYPRQLSGGERQRVAIARALLIDPHLLLMDEPLASLDAQRKEEILPYLINLRKEFVLPIFYVSHSIDEVARLADYLVVLKQGRVLASGPIGDVLARTDNAIVDGMSLGENTGVVVQAEIVEQDTHWHLTRVAFAGGELWVRSDKDCIGQTLRIRVLARDISITLTAPQDSSILNRLAAEVIDIAPDADEAMCLIRLQVGATIFIARITQRSLHFLRLVSGSRVWAQIKSVAVVR